MFVNSYAANRIAIRGMRLVIPTCVYSTLVGGFEVLGFNTTYTLDEFLWARTVISTRVFGWRLPGLPVENPDFMVPLGDMFNHRSPKQIEWVFNSTTQTLDYWAQEDVAAGGELLISYGGKCNSQYLLHYGPALALLKLCSIDGASYDCGPTDCNQISASTRLTAKTYGVDLLATLLY